MNNKNSRSIAVSDQANVQKTTDPSLYVRYLPVIILVLVALTATVCAGIFMGHETLMTVAMAATTIPALLLLIYIYKSDVIESEPAGLLYLLFISGILATVPVILIKLLLGSSLSPVVMVAILSLVEELSIYLVLYFETWDHLAFNYRFDGVVYGATVAIGYEVSLAVLYLSGGLEKIALSRSVIPVHCALGIYMGFFYGQAKARMLEGDKSGAALMQVFSLLLPIVLNFVYELFMSNSSNQAIMIFFIAFLVLLNVAAVICVRKFSRADRRLGR
ncbi:MAG: PrsW family intramembrane metalloprotease [Butyrivibrio sp.]|nr:PrsW family intramembrane metalloprotease [Butyrivibrio sp.]